MVNPCTKKITPFCPLFKAVTVRKSTVAIKIYEIVDNRVQASQSSKMPLPMDGTLRFASMSTFTRSRMRICRPYENAPLSWYANHSAIRWTKGPITLLVKTIFFIIAISSLNGTPCVSDRTMAWLSIHRSLWPLVCKCTGVLNMEIYIIPIVMS